MAAAALRAFYQSSIPVPYLQSPKTKPFVFHTSSHHLSLHIGPSPKPSSHKTLESRHDSPLLAPICVILPFFNSFSVFESFPVDIGGEPNVRLWTFGVGGCSDHEGGFAFLCGEEVGYGDSFQLRWDAFVSFCSMYGADAFWHGVGDSLFPVCLGFSLIVMYDAIGVRRHAGMQAEVLNKIVEDLFQAHPLSKRKLKELLGHTPSQVLAGALLGILVAYICCQNIIPI